MAAPGDRATHLALTVVVALLVGGCAASRAAPPVTPKPSTLPLTAATTAPATTATTAASAAASGPLTGRELAWLEAIAKLGDKTDGIIDKVLAVMTVPPSAMTAARLRSLAGELRACSRELARLGSPSGRLQPVYHLAQRACAQFDKGARCLATAAGLGTPAAGSAEERKLDRAVDCGASAPEDGSDLLLDAELKGEDIEDAAG